MRSCSCRNFSLCASLVLVLGAPGLGLVEARTVEPAAAAVAGAPAQGRQVRVFVGHRGDVGASGHFAIERADQPPASAVRGPVVRIGGREESSPAVVDLTVHLPTNSCDCDFFHFPVALGVGDLNGDGRGDLVFNDADLVDGRLDAGSIHVLFGPFQDRERDVEAGSDVVVTGAASGELLASSLAIADLTGDGVDDLIVLAPKADTYQRAHASYGQAYLLAGPLRQGTVDIARDAARVAIYGDDRHRTFTDIVTGDVNGDGQDDLVLSGNGAVHVVHGPIGETSAVEEVDLWVASRTFVESVTDGGLGSSVALGDLNGDGVNDLVVAEYRADAYGPDRADAGRVVVVFGPLAEGPQVVLDDGSADVVVYGRDEKDYIDHVTVADVSGDRVDDLIITASGDGPSGNRPGAGEAIVIFGPLAADTTIDLAAVEPEVVVFGGAAGDALRLAEAADVTGDGIADLILGAFQGDGDGDSAEDAGEVHVLIGPLARGSVIDLASMSADVSVYGADGVSPSHYGDRFGAMIVAGDLTGDGRDDLIVGAPLAQGPNNSRRTAGQVYVFSEVFGASNQAPVADPGGPYEAPCDGGVLGIWIDGAGSFDPDPLDTLSFSWSTSCPGAVISRPNSALTPIQFDCTPCFRTVCDVTLTVTDPHAAHDSATAIFRQRLESLCLEMGNQLWAAGASDDVELWWSEVAAADEYHVARSSSRDLGSAELLEVGAVLFHRDVDAPSESFGPAALTFYGVVAIGDGQSAGP